MELEDELGDIIEKARDGKQWSQQDLARATGILGMGLIAAAAVLVFVIYSNSLHGPFLFDDTNNECELRSSSILLLAGTRAQLDAYDDQYRVPVPIVLSLGLLQIERKADSSPDEKAADLSSSSS